MVKHLGDDWVAVTEDPNKAGFIWVNVGQMSKQIDNNPVLLPYGDAIYREKRFFFANDLPLPPKATKLVAPPPVKKVKSNSEEITVPSGVVDAKTAWEYVEAHNYQLAPNVEHFLAQNAKYAYLYAYKVLRIKRPTNPRFMKAEPLIAKSDDHAYFYAANILHKRWPEAEPTIAKWPQFVSQYCKDFNLTFDKATHTFR